MNKIIFFILLLLINLFAYDFDSITKEQKEKMYYKMGEKIHKKLCPTLSSTNYNSIQELATNININTLCKKKLNEKQTVALSLYIWDKEHLEHKHSNNLYIEVDEKEKCPVCGMFVAKYPKWAAQIVYKIDNKKVKFSFDGVKDLFKFYFNSKKWLNKEYKISQIEKIMVSDYYTQDAIDGKKAFYVIGSDVYGPMGNEFIPFISLEDAKTFKEDHLGVEILSFDEITEEKVYKLDE